MDQSNERCVNGTHRFGFIFHSFSLDGWDLYKCYYSAHSIDIFPFRVQYEDFDQLIKASLLAGRKHAAWSFTAGSCFETSQYSHIYN